MCARKVREKCFNLEPRRQVETCPEAGWRLAWPQWTVLQREILSVATCHIPSFATYVRTCMCNTFVMIAQIVILITEFNKTNKNKGKTKRTWNVRYISHFLLPKMRSACTLWASSLQRVLLSLLCQQSKFLFKLSSRMISQLNTFSLVFSAIFVFLLAFKFFGGILWVVFA